MFFENTQKPFEVILKRDELDFRFCNSFSKAARDFEDNLIRSKSFEHISFIDDSNQLRNVSWPNLSHWQSYRFLINQNKPYYLLQMSNKRTNSNYQIVISVGISKLSLFKAGTIQQWIMRTDENSFADQYELIKQLISFCKTYTKLMSIRIQPYMPGTAKLESTQKLLSQLGFIETVPLSYTKTRMFDLRPSTEEMLELFSANGRARLKIKPKYENQIEIKEIDNIATIPCLQQALNASFERSSKKECAYNFLPLFLGAKQFEKKVQMLGFYFKDENSEPKAFVSGVSHESIFEYSVAGSLSDSQLRQFPFNHILIWQLALRSKKIGCELLDLGGVTSGVNDEALAGITNFKRFFPGFELSIGREMEIELRPEYLKVYSMLKNFYNLVVRFIRRT